MADLRLEVDAESLSRLIKRLGHIKSSNVLRPPMERGLSKLQRELADYPAASGKRQPPKSRKQQIKQILLAKEGKIPYRRTGDLGRSWTSVIDESGDGIEGTVGNAVASRETGTHYGPLVQGAGEQASYHRGTWQTDEQVLEHNRRSILDDFADAIERAMD